jgi:hypothetical protein
MPAFWLYNVPVKLFRKLFFFPPKSRILDLLQIKVYLSLARHLIKNLHNQTWKIICHLQTWRLEFITNLMHNFIYSIIILHHDPQHVSSIGVLIFRRTIVCLQYLVSSHSVCSHTVHRSSADCSPLLIGALYGSIQIVTIPDTANIQLSSWRWAQRCSKHVEDHDVI